MPAILDDIRRLDAAHARGEISAVALAAAKAQLMDSIPDVTPDAPVLDAEPADETKRSPDLFSGNGLSQIILFCAVVLILCTGLALLFTGDLFLSATLGITVLAAFSVMLFRQLDG